MAGRPLRRIRRNASASCGLSDSHVRENGVIQIPKEVRARALKALRSALDELADRPWDPENLPSSHKDLNRQDSKRSASRIVDLVGITAYGKAIPSFSLYVYMSKEGAEWIGGDWARGAFSTWGGFLSRLPPEIIVAVTKKDLDERRELNDDSDLCKTLFHEIRHLIQYAISRSMPDKRESDYYEMGSVLEGGPTIKRTRHRSSPPLGGGPPRKARAERTRAPEEVEPKKALIQYFTSDIEFQPRVATHAERAAAQVRSGFSTPTEAVRAATADPFLRLLAELAPEKWKAAVRIISSEVNKVPRLPDLTPTGKKPSTLPYPRPTPSVRDMERSPTKNFRGAYLRGTNFGFSKAFAGADFTGADLREADLDFVVLAGANLTNANLSHAQLLETDFTGANLTNASLTDTVLAEALFEKANLSGAYLNRTAISGQPFRKANLRGANLTGANLTMAKLSNVDLTGADLTRANLTGAKLSGTALEDAILKDTIMPDGKVYRSNPGDTGATRTSLEPLMAGRPLRRAREALNNPRRTLRRDAIRFEGAAFSPDGFVMQYIALFDPAILGPLYNTHAGVPLEYVSRQAQFVLGGAWLYYPTEAAFDDPQFPATVEYIAAGEGFGPDIIQAVADKAGHPLKLSHRAWEASERLFARFGGTVYPSENPVPYRDERFGADWALRLQPGMQAIYSSASWGYNNRQEGSAALPRYLEAADPQAQLRQDEDAVRGKLLQKPLPLPPPEPRARR